MDGGLLLLFPDSKAKMATKTYLDELAPYYTMGTIQWDQGMEFISYLERSVMRMIA